LTITFRGGRKAPHAESARPRLKLSQFLTGTYPPAPAVVDYVSKVADWPMYGNDQYGDCVWAMIGHTIEAATTYGQGQTVKVSDADVLKGYSAVTGFDPADPSTDQGTVIQDALDYWRKVGVGGHKIMAFAQIDHTNLDEIDAALYLFGHVQLGIDFPAVAMDQFNEGKPWDVVADDGGNEGGHAISGGLARRDAATPFPPRPELVGKNARGNYVVITWGRAQEMTPAFFARYVEEAWTVITPEWYDAQGRNPEGIDAAALGEGFTALTGEPNPFRPAPDPGPTPEPPAPAPDPADPADEVLAAVVRPWLKYRHRGANAALARQLRTWLTAKNLTETIQENS
jgi:hypothetical protein